MNNKFRIQKALFFLMAVFLSIASWAQSTISGTITDTNGGILSGASIIVEHLNKGTLSNEFGKFELQVPESGTYNLVISYLGLKTQKKLVEIGNSITDLMIQLSPDPLELGSIIVTGTFNEASKLESSVASTTLTQKNIQSRTAFGTADLLKAVPGTFADASAGEIFTRVYSRGIAASAEDDIGWYYMSLQEDGLPVTNYHTTYYGPDLFHRVDQTVHRLEAIRGGSAATTNTNAPGGTFNFISKTGANEFAGQMLITGALQGESNPLLRYDLSIGGPLNNTWTYSIGGFYRYDQGARNTDITWGNGGQLKGNIVRTSPNSYFKIYAKYLNDKVNRYQGLAAINWTDPQPAFGQRFNYTALNLPKISTYIADGRFAGKDADATYGYNTNKGVQTKDLALGLAFGKEFNDWNLQGNLKISNKSAHWQSSIANQPLGLEGFFPYLLNGIDPNFMNIPLGQVVFRDAQTNDVLARVNNFGILNVFQGQAPSFEYLEGSLPNDAILGIAPWKKLDEATELMEQLTLSKQFDSHKITGGIYAAYSDIESFTSASFAYATYENSPQALTVTLENPDMPIVQLSDPTGISNYGGLLYNRANASIAQLGLSINDRFYADEKMIIDLGLRYDLIRHKGEKDRASPTFALGGLDGNELTAYDNSVLLADAVKDPFNFTYHSFSWSLGINHQLSEDMALFGRMSHGHKAPEMNYYFNNFDGIPIDRKGAVQDIWQYEFGFKFLAPKFSLFSTAFWSQLGKVPFSEFVLDQASGNIFFTPTQFNEAKTYGLEVESDWALLKNFHINFTATLQKGKAISFTFYNANETIESNDDFTLDYSGKALPHNPNIMLEISPIYTNKNLEAFVAWRYMGEREGNYANAFQLPAFSTVHAGVNYQINRSINISLIGNNLLNSAGLMNFFGPNEFGSNANAATPAYIAQNPNASFVVFPISPRSIYLKVGYDF